MLLLKIGGVLPGSDWNSVGERGRTSLLGVEGFWGLWFLVTFS